MQPLAGDEPVGAEGDDERRGVDDQDPARRRGEDEPPVEEDELAREQGGDREAEAERAVALEERHPPREGIRPEEERRARRAQAGLEQGRHPLVGDLDRDLREAPDRAEGEQEAHRPRVEGRAPVVQTSPRTAAAISCWVGMVARSSESL